MIQFNPNINKIWLDQDGVLANLEKFVTDRLGPTWHDGQMWALLKREDRPFRRFEPMPDVQLLWDTCQELSNGRTEILTAIPQNHRDMPTVPEDKREWFVIHRNIFGDSVKFNIGPYARDKHKHGQPGDILIDDNAKNIVDWHYMTGGIGIFHTSVESTLSLLKVFARPYKAEAPKIKVCAKCGDPKTSCFCNGGYR